MKQIILPFRNGQPELIEAPVPNLLPGEVLIRNTASVVSPGTERMLIEFGKAGWIGKLRAQPERAQQVLQKMKTDGFLATLRAVKGKLDRPISLGYSSAGIVLAVGSGIQDIRPGDRVASNGPHAEIVSVARNLIAKIPDEVLDEEAAFTTLGAIALQGIRLAAPSFGETVVVIGLGLIGQLTAQLLLANGCRVLGAELSEPRKALAAAQGLIPLTQRNGDEVRALTGGHGADAVIITAAAQHDSILNAAADMCRKRGRVILSGVVDMKLSRDVFFKKELSFQVSSSYGPGRYEPGYEQQGLDYPIGYVRWTENRNFEAVLEALRSKKLDVKPLISSRLPFTDALQAYAQLGTKDPGMAIVFEYPKEETRAETINQKQELARQISGKGIALIGAGNFASAVLFPALRKEAASLHWVISRNGLSAAMLAQKSGSAEAGTDLQDALEDTRIEAVVIATPHSSHAAQTIAALKAGKHVFVEKPLALTRQELEAIRQAWARSGCGLTVGFNRRFAPFAQQAKSLMPPGTAPFNICITVNAGSLPVHHWLSDRAIQGGRIIGEACHFIDLCCFFTGSRINAVCANRMDGADEDASILLRFADGSQAVLNYFCNGAKAYDKERVELHRAGQSLIIENWRRLKGYGFSKSVALSSRQDKGHEQLIHQWLGSLKGDEMPMQADEIWNSSLASIAVSESLNEAAWIKI
ncbi:MAG: bi-domain-containing oxidoreductase [Bacteroidetes bacterium]|nr:bi-domain-containing oxidoreductase [Bacteroidota bacterium]